LFGLFRQPKCEFRHHPSKGVLKLYVDDKLRDGWPPCSEEVCSKQATLCDVSLHVARCDRCSNAVARLRYPEQPLRCGDEERICAFGYAGQRFGLWASAYAAVALVFLTLSWEEPANTRLSMAPVQHDAERVTLQPNTSGTIDYKDYLSGHSLMTISRGVRSQPRYYPSFQAF